MTDLEKKMGVFGVGWKHGQNWSRVTTEQTGVAMTKRKQTLLIQDLIVSSADYRNDLLI